MREQGVLVVNQQVGQFEVSMHDPAIVQELTRLQQLTDKCLRVRQLERGVHGIQHTCEVASADVFKHQVDTALHGAVHGDRCKILALDWVASRKPGHRTVSSHLSSLLPVTTPRRCTRFSWRQACRTLSSRTDVTGMPTQHFQLARRCMPACTRRTCTSCAVTHRLARDPCAAS